MQVAKLRKVERTASGVKVTWTTANGAVVEKEAEQVLIGVGRSPRPENIEIETTRIELDRGFVKVYEAQKTAEPGIYAIGDITAGLPQLAHVGAMSGIVAVTKIAGRPFRPVRQDRIPACIYWLRPGDRIHAEIENVGALDVGLRDEG